MSNVIIKNIWQMPNHNETITLTLSECADLMVGSWLWNPSVGYLKVVSYSGYSIYVDVTSPNLEGNAAPGTTFPSNMEMVICAPQALYAYDNATCLTTDVNIIPVGSTGTIKVEDYTGFSEGDVIVINRDYLYEIESIDTTTDVITIKNYGKGATTIIKAETDNCTPVKLLEQTECCINLQRRMNELETSFTDRSDIKASTDNQLLTITNGTDALINSVDVTLKVNDDLSNYDNTISGFITNSISSNFFSQGKVYGYNGLQTSGWIKAETTITTNASHQNSIGFVNGSVVKGGISYLTGDILEVGTGAASVSIPTDLSITGSTSGISYNDLSNKPTIPTKTSDLTNDSGFITISSVPTKTSDLTNDSGFITIASVPTKTSDLTNDSGFITIASVPTKTSDLTNDSGFITIASVPTKTSDLINDSGFITGISNINDIGNVTITSPSHLQILKYDGTLQKWVNGTPSTVTVAWGDISGNLSNQTDLSNALDAKQDEITSTNPLDVSLVDGLATVATTGAYTDLSGKPTIPTKTSDLTNDSGFITIASVPTKTSDLSNDSGFITNSVNGSFSATGHITAGNRLLCGGHIITTITEDTFIGYSYNNDIRGVWYRTSGNTLDIGDGADAVKIRTKLNISYGYQCRMGTSGSSTDNYFNIGAGKHLYINAADQGIIQTSSSDRRIKKNIKDMEYGLEDVLKLRPVTFNKYEDPTHGGFIAQEVLEVIPEAVEVPENPETELYGLDMFTLIALQAKAIQELNAKVENLTTRIEELENANN